jgi:hypothetical protein
MLGLTVAACDGGVLSVPGTSMTCTLIGCEDQFTATVSVTASAVPAGTHTVVVTADGTSSSCSFTLPPQNLAAGDNAAAQCPAGLEVIVGATQVCMTTQSGDVTASHCDPVPGQLTEQISVMGSPASIRVEQSVGGTVVLDQSATPAYQTNEPNGSGCGPICHQAGADWTIP